MQQGLFHSKAVHEPLAEVARRIPHLRSPGFLWVLSVAVAFSSLNPTAVSKHLLARTGTSGPFLCHMCSKPCGKAPKAVKKHYLELHMLNVSLSQVPLEDTPSQRTTLSVEAPSPPVKGTRVRSAHPPVVEYSSEDDDDDFMDTDSPSPMAPPLSAEAGRGFPGAQSDEEDEWEGESMDSDTSTEVLLFEDDDDVVPCSFNLPGLPNPSSGDDCLEFDGPLPESPLESKGMDRPFLAGVYGSNSGYPLTAPATLS
jgi:hypothetical protein